MKKLFFALSLFLSLSSLVHAQWALNGINIYNTNGGNVGIGTQTPSNYFHGGNNKVLEIFNSNNVINSQSHVVLSTGATADGSSAGTLTWVSKNSTGVQGMAYIGSVLQGDATTNAASKIIFATSNGSAVSQKMLLDKDGNVGIGTTNPNTKLDVNGVISMNSFGYLSSLRMPANNFTNLFLGGGIKDNADGTYSVYTDGGSNYFSAIRMDNGGNNVGAINFYDGISVGVSNYNITNANLLNYLRMTINGNGNVGIGITTPQNKLDVNGTIHSKAVNIDLNGWNDYVFKKDYQLRSLSEVKAYIDQNQHLPEIPSEQEMVKKGLDVGEMNKLLMKKVEELTLYLIEKDQQVKEQNKRIDEQQKQINKLIEAGHK